MQNKPRSIITTSLILALLGLSCTDEAGTVKTLQSYGFKDIQTTGVAWFECGKDDSFATSFTATNTAGLRVSGAVCCGWLKNCTVRF